ncbi:hypothetical protein O3P69_019316 [Scylla paramamosain]|uniref:Uncharacterized protein n=1 Tax=Scylla paramamosain TaxID=85552 RepID=A0AAW0SVA1_SCYPA
MSGQVLCAVKMAPFSAPVRLPPQPDTRQQEMSRQLKDALESVIVLEKFPKSQIDVYVTVIEDDGSLLGACITAAGLALCHANIDVYDLVVGASVLFRGDVLYLDPRREEEEVSDNNQLTIGMIPKHAGGQIALMVQRSGQVAPQCLSECLNAAVDLCNRLHSLAQKTLLVHLQETLAHSSSSSSSP